MRYTLLLILLENIPLNVRDNEIWIQPDDAPPHNANIIRDCFHTNFQSKRMGTRVPLNWIRPYS